MEVSEASEALIRTLEARGWCFADIDQVRATIVIHSALADDEICTLDSVEAELANMDLRSVGGPSLPEPSFLRRSSHILGPKVLQISSARDISRSSIEDASKSSSKRLLRLTLTDGHTEITAIEYSHIPTIPDDIVPGTKVRLENKVAIRNGIICLNSNVVTVVGGVVQSLYEEWQMNKKFSGFSRSSLRQSLEIDSSGPPPFEKLQIGASTSYCSQQSGYNGYSESSSKTFPPSVIGVYGKSKNRQMGGHQIISSTPNFENSETPTHSRNTEEKPRSFETRPKEVADYNPVQNQEASQKLLLTMNHQNKNDHQRRCGRKKGKGKNEELPIYTLDEWEKKRTEAKPQVTTTPADSCHDEYLARQLQDQFDLEDHPARVEKHPHDTVARNVKMSMFNFEREDHRIHEEGERRGGRGGGRRRRGGGRRGG